MSSIRALDRVVQDQIAAGEVVERPASVVKELLENALDAGARRIEIRLEEGGTRLIEIRDDGHGIPAPELGLALTAHATSKIFSVEELEGVTTLGFRGEALASIAAVSRLEITSRTARGEGAQLQVQFGRVGEVRPAAASLGTRIQVADLFGELPARRKFLKRASTERAHCVSWVERLALAHVGIGFRIFHEGKVLLDIAPEDDLAARCGAIFGRGIADAMVQAHVDTDLLKMEALIGPPESARRGTARSHVFLNGRWVRDPRLMRALREGLREFVPGGQLPPVVLSLAVPPERVDVNVHPQKTEVRLRDERLVVSAIIRGLRAGLSLSPWATRSVGPVGSSRDGAGEPSVPRVQSWEFPAPRPVAGPSLGEGDPSLSGVPDPKDPQLPLESTGEIGHFLTVARTFLLREVPGGLEILDQHALHERINLEELRQGIRSGKVVSQPLLVPALVDLSREEMAMLLGRTEVLAKLGVEVVAFGETTIAIRAVPARLSRLNPEGLVEDLLEIVAENRSAEPDQIQERMLLTMACRAAVMAGDRVDEEQLKDFLRRGAGLPQDRTCAHGRPVRVFLSVEDLERAFHRR